MYYMSIYRIENLLKHGGDYSTYQEIESRPADSNFVDGDEESAIIFCGLNIITISFNKW